MKALEAPDKQATEVKQALESFSQNMLARYNETSGEPGASSQGAPFERVYVQDTSGLTLARWPPPRGSDDEFLNKEYAWRDYFEGAKSRVSTKSRKAYISRAFVSESHHRLTFALSVPVYSEKGTWLGVLVTTVASDSTLDSLPLNTPGAANHNTVTLVSLMDRNRGEALPPASRYAVVIHDQIKQRGTPLFLEEEFGKQLERALSKPRPPKPGQPSSSSFESKVLEDYRDPVSKEPLLAVFAPLEDTSFVVIMQTREQAARAANTLLTNRFVWWSLPFALGLGLLWLVFWGVRSRSLG